MCDNIVDAWNFILFEIMRKIVGNPMQSGFRKRLRDGVSRDRSSYRADKSKRRLMRYFEVMDYLSNNIIDRVTIIIIRVKPLKKRIINNKAK